MHDVPMRSIACALAGAALIILGAHNLAGAAGIAPAASDSAGDLRQPGSKPEPPLYYEEEIRRTIERSESEKRMEEDQDRYYKQQSENAAERNERLDREADKYYGRR